MTKSRGIRNLRGVRQAWVAAEQGRHLCGCGCGQPVVLRVEHFNIGVPRFLHGHNPTREPRAETPRKACACGCGALAGPGKRFVSGHNSRGRRRTAETRLKLREQKVGDRNPMYGQTPWNAKEPVPQFLCCCGCGEMAGSGRYYISGHNAVGARLSNFVGRYTTPLGYVRLYAPEHPHATKGYVFEHRLVVERHLRQTDPDSPYLYQLGEHLYLRPEYVVHHLNEVKNDNRVENLTPLTPAEHRRVHNGQG